MQVYFDKKNLVSYIKSSKDSRFRYCQETLLTHCKIFMNFTKEELLNEDDEDAEIIMSWMKVCSEGFETEKWNWNGIFPARNIKSNTPVSFSPEQHSAVYMISDDKLHLLVDKHQYIVSDLGKEVDTLSQLWFDDRQYTMNIFDKLDKWEKLKNYTSPCSDIIMCDQFFLLKRYLLEYNIYELLTQLCKESQCARMNIVIFTLKDHQGYPKPDFTQIRSVIKSRIKAKTGLSPFVTIVTGSGQKLQEHDRTIFTNYKLYNSGDSFNYFDSTGKRITKGRYFHIHSLVSKSNERTARSFIDDMQGLYNSINRDAPDNIYKEQNCKSNYMEL